MSCLGVFGGGNAAPWAGVEGGNDCRFENNWIDHVAYEVEDSGGFYTCGQAGELNKKIHSIADVCGVS